MKRLRDKKAVFPNQFSIKVNLATPFFLPLDTNQIPMHLGFVPIVGHLVGLTGSEVKGPGNLFIKQNVLHRLLDVGIESDGKFSDKTSSLITI